MGEKLISNTFGPRSTAEEIQKNFLDLHPPLSPQEAKAESSRCLFCYDAPCVQACPTSIDVPKFIRQIATDNLKGSAKTILGANIMGGTCARVCPTEILCEEKCVLKAGEANPIQIGALQRVAVDHWFSASRKHPFPRAEQTGKTVAVVGAGPAGLACAHALAVRGHNVTIFEAKQKAGGLNEYGLAAYKMVDNFAAKEIAFILEVGGIDIRCGQVMGVDFSLDDIRSQFDAVFLGLGLGKPRRLYLEGIDKQGVGDALTFIENLRQAVSVTDMKVGEQVVVIGGGNTAVDAAVQAKRLGARDVTLAYRRGPKQMGATEFEQELAATNGINLLLWAKPIALKGQQAVEGVEFERTRLDAGTLVGTGETFVIPTDQVLVAIGQQLQDESISTLEVNSGKIVVDGDHATSMAGVFAGGDCIASGEDLTVQSVQDGKQAAAAIHTYIMER